MYICTYSYREKPKILKGHNYILRRVTFCCLFFLMYIHEICTYVCVHTNLGSFCTHYYLVGVVLTQQYVKVAFYLSE